MLQLKTKGSDDLKAVISAISTLDEEATFVANSEGITFRGMDPSHVALIDISWPKESFEEYRCDDEIKFGVRTAELAKLIKRADKKDDLQISITEQNMLLVQMGKKKRYTLRLMESSTQDTPLPKIAYNSKIVLSTTQFDKILGDVQVVTDYITFKTDGSKIKFSGKGDSGEVEISMDGSDESIEEITSTDQNEGTYSLEYLNPIVKAVGNTTGLITCEFSDHKPLRVEFKVSNIVRIHFYLAPRVETS